MLRIAWSSVNRRLIRNTFCYGSEVVPVQCKLGPSFELVTCDHNVCWFHMTVKRFALSALIALLRIEIAY